MLVAPPFVGLSPNLPPSPQSPIVISKLVFVAIEKVPLDNAPPPPPPPPPQSLPRSTEVSP